MYTYTAYATPVHYLLCSLCCRLLLLCSMANKGEGSLCIFFNLPLQIHGRNDKNNNLKLHLFPSLPDNLQPDDSPSRSRTKLGPQWLMVGPPPQFKTPNPKVANDFYKFHGFFHWTTLFLYLFCTFVGLVNFGLICMKISIILTLFSIMLKIYLGVKYWLKTWKNIQFVIDKVGISVPAFFFFLHIC